MKKLLVDILWYQIRLLGMPLNEPLPLESFVQKCEIVPVYKPWLRECFRIFEAEGYIVRKGEIFEANHFPEMSEDNVWAEFKQEKSRWLNNEDLGAQMILLDRALMDLANVLRGDVKATEVVFPNSSVSLVENIYKNNPMAAYFNEILVSCIGEYLKKHISSNPNARLRILEIGAGTGATSEVVLRSLKNYEHYVEEYCYTDISRAFLNHAESAYGKDYSFLTYRLLNIDSPLSEQDIDFGAFDIVIAANVLHATKNITSTIRNTKYLLKKDGALFLNELSTNNLFNHLTFGLLEGWWLYNDPELRLPGSPGLSSGNWQHVLQKEGFRAIAFPSAESSDLGQQIIVSQSDGVVRLPNMSRFSSNVSKEAASTTENQYSDIAIGKAVSSMDQPTVRQEEIARVESTVLAALVSALRISKDRIRSDEPFSSYGLDSIIAVSLARSIGSDLGVSLDITALFEHNTVECLTSRILELMGEALGEDDTDSSLLDLNSGSIEPDVSTFVDENKGERVFGRISSTLVQVLASSLRIDPAKIALTEPFSSYGLDSIIAVSLVRSINSALAIDMDITVIFEYSTVEKLGSYIAANYGPSLFGTEKKDIYSEVAPPENPAYESGVVGVGLVSGNKDTNPKEYINDRDFNQSNRRMEFAIVGINGRFPGADDINGFWQLILEGRNCVSNPPLNRSDWKAFSEEGLYQAFGINNKWAGFIDEIHGFDPLFFGIAPVEAKSINSEQRQLLMSVWNAIEDAGYTQSELSQHATGVFVAVGPGEYPNLKDDESLVQEASLLDSPSLSLIPNRISYLFNLCGPSEMCDTTCSSSLVALHRAIQSMQLGECEQAIVGGVNLIQSPVSFAGMESAGMLSPTGISAPFQTTANGTVRGEGVGALLIKPLETALKDNDFVYAVVKGSGVCHGGRGVSLTAPNIRGMKMAMRQAYAAADIDPGTVDYIEAHGMGSNLADSAEISAIKSTLDDISDLSRSAQPDNRPTYISCLKPCIGHTEVFSGMASLIKVVLALRNRKIPMIPRFSALSGDISLENSPLEMAVDTVEWDQPVDQSGGKIPRRASINSYGIGGVNAHVVLEESPIAQEYQRSDSDILPQIVVLSARDDGALKRRAADLLRYLEMSPDVDLRDIAFTLQEGRDAMTKRFSVVVSSISDLVAVLNHYLDFDCSSMESSTGFFLGNSGNRSEDMGELFNKGPGEKIVALLVQTQQWDLIARLWAKGIDVSWSALGAPGRRGRRIPLPAYPFRVESIETTQYDFPELGEDNGSNLKQQEHLSVEAEYLVELIAAFLGIPVTKLNPDSPLEEYGLNSLLLVKLSARIIERYPDFNVEWLTPSDSINALATRLRGSQGIETIAREPGPGRKYIGLIKLNASTQGRPIFWIHGALGSVESFQAVARNSDRPFYGIQAQGFFSEASPLVGVPAMAAHYIHIMKSVQLEGPYDIGGFCLGGIIAYEMTRQLIDSGDEVGSCLLIDSPDNTSFQQAGGVTSLALKNAALQVANMLLWPPGHYDLKEITQRLIHQSDLDASLDDEIFLDALADMIVERGLHISKKEVLSLLKQNIEIQIAYQIDQYMIPRLPVDNSVNCYYLRNRNSVFYGDFSCYFTVSGDDFSLDGLPYWRDWEEKIINFKVFDIDAPNHMTILSEPNSVKRIVDICNEIYSREVV